MDVMVEILVVGEACWYNGSIDNGSIGISIAGAPTGEESRLDNRTENIC